MKANTNFVNEYLEPEKSECKFCEKIQNGFHDCNKILEQYTKKCGCRIVRKYGFMSLSSVYLEEWIETTPCKVHEIINKISDKATRIKAVLNTNNL